MPSTEATAAARARARGLGRYYQRLGVRRDLAVQYALTLHPEMAGRERDIARGWNAERSGR